ncbi:MAG: UpxY family transcription antiterminator [Candidatus Acidiferrales bacterium]
MTALAVSLSSMDLIGEIPKSLPTAHWYAAYTSANHEKRVAEQLAQRRVENFLPLYEAVHRWKDRRVRLQLPLFPGYVFVRLPLSEKLKILQLPGVARLVGFGDRPVSLPEDEIESLRRGLRGDVKMEPHPYLSEGRRVRIMRGPLTGMEGVLLRKKGNWRLVLSIDLLMRSIVVDVDAADTLPINTQPRRRPADVSSRGFEPKR